LYKSTFLLLSEPHNTAESGQSRSVPDPISSTLLQDRDTPQKSWREGGHH